MAKFSIQINETTDSEEAMADVLTEIARKLENGYWCGSDPNWTLLEEESEEDV